MNGKKGEKNRFPLYNIILSCITMSMIDWWCYDCYQYEICLTLAYFTNLLHKGLLLSEPFLALLKHFILFFLLFHGKNKAIGTKKINSADCEKRAGLHICGVGSHYWLRGLLFNFCLLILMLQSCRNSGCASSRLKVHPLLSCCTCIW